VELFLYLRAASNMAAHSEALSATAGPFSLVASKEKNDCEYDNVARQQKQEQPTILHDNLTLSAPEDAA